MSALGLLTFHGVSGKGAREAKSKKIGRNKGKRSKMAELRA